MTTRVVALAVVVPVLVGLTGGTASACAIPADIMPGVHPNLICLEDPGVLPVVMFEPDVNALAMAHPDTARLGRLYADCEQGLAPDAWWWEDVNGDGYDDLYYEFTIPALVAAGILAEDTTRLTLCVYGEWGDHWPDSFCSVDVLDGTNGVYPLPGGPVGDWVWEDVNGDGVQDPDEPGIPDVVVDLFDEAGDLVDTQVTDADGYYLFEQVCVGEYTVAVDPASLPPGALPTTPYAESDKAIDSNESPEVVFLDYDEQENWTIDFGYVIEEECGPCEGKVTELTLEYLGDVPDTHVVIAQKVHRQGRGRRGWTRVVVFDGIVQPGETFSFVGQDKKGTLGPWIWVRVNDEWHPKIHTSCSRPIGPGAVFGDFEVVAGVSRIGGALCPLEDGGDDPPPQGGFLWFLLLWLKRFGLG